jgi:uncharacterized protein
LVTRILENYLRMPSLTCHSEVVQVAITGANGFLGRHVSARLREHTIRAVSTRNGVRAQDFAGCDAVIHLAGEPVAQRWTTAARERIRSSRVEGTRDVVAALRSNPPKVLISASAIGYYGSRGDEVLTEPSAPASDFLGQLAVEWEREARAAEQLGVRVVSPRISVVLGRDGGALQKMLTPFRLGVGGRIGSGKQWMSWIHVDDLVELIAFAIQNDIRGPLNACSPNPVTNATFTRELARALHRPAIFPVPKIALKLVFGEMSQVIYSSQRVMPEATVRTGFEFRFPEIGAAFDDLFGHAR